MSDNQSASQQLRKRKIASITILVILTINLVLGVSYLLTRHWIADQSKTAEQSQPEINRYSKLSDIHFDDNKINFYIFWGNGCIHCEHLFEYLDEIWPDYSQYFNLYAFEIWDNKDNMKIMDYFMEQLGQPTGQATTPTFIIGDQLFQGFSEGSKQEIIDTIKSRYENRDSIQDFSGVLRLQLDDGNGDSNNSNSAGNNSDETAN